MIYPWPIPPGFDSRPVWTGRGFRVGGQQVSVLSYAVGASGWSDDLTVFHENTAGSDHCIDQASRRHALQQVRRQATRPAPVILEVGSSSGFLLEALREQLPAALVIGSDFVREPLERLAQRRPDLPLLHFDLVRCPLPSASIDIVVMLNVLEHIRDDVAALGQIGRILKPGGAVVIEVPAGPHLYDVYDRVLQHQRRYQLTDLRRLLRQAGLAVAHASSLGALLYPGFWYAKKRNQRYLDADERVQQQMVAQAIRQTSHNPWLELAFWLEERLRPLVPLPVGIRCLATAVKPPRAA